MPATRLTSALRSTAGKTRRAAALGVDRAAFPTWSLSREGRANLGRIQELKGRFPGRRCVVMGNGPSLLKADLNRLRDAVTIVSNAHFLIWDQLEYLPTLLTVEDRLVAEDRADELRQLPVTRIYPFDLRETLGPANEKVIYVNFPRVYKPFPKFSDDLVKRAYWGGTVSFFNLQLACYLGCNPIALIGFDHSYKVPAADRIDQHVITSDAEDVNHIHPEYFGPGYRWHDPNVARMEISYALARRELEARGIDVVNATHGGHLEVFARKSLDAFLEGS
jgi:hypothetical protein